MRAADRDAEDEDAEGQDHGDLEDEEDEAREDLREQVVATCASGVAVMQLQGLLHARVDDRRSRCPRCPCPSGSSRGGPAAGSRCSASPSRARTSSRRRDRIRAAGRALDRVVDLEAREARVGPRRIEVVDERRPPSTRSAIFPVRSAWRPPRPTRRERLIGLRERQRVASRPVGASPSTPTGMPPGALSRKAKPSTSAMIDRERRRPRRSPPARG